MGLRDRLQRPEDDQWSDDLSPAPATTDRDDARRATYQHIKLVMHRLLIEQFDVARQAIVDTPATRREINALVERLLQQENPPLNQEERQRLVKDLEHETFGLGPLEPLLRDPTINDILVNRWDEVYVERAGRLERTEVVFRDNVHLLQVIERIVNRVGRRIDESSPMVDARLPDGSRINAIIPPVAVDGPSLSIRRFKQTPLTMTDLVRFGSLNQLTASLLEAAVKAKSNILISGGSGSGKTTLLNALVHYIGESERLVSIEDTIELRLEGLHAVRLETRPANVERRGEITQRDLVRNALRMRPDRILVGEVRGDEAYDMLQAMNTGHKGSLATIHSNSPRDALARLETMILMAGLNLTSETMRRQISSAIDLVVQVERFPDGVRRLVSVSEVAGMEGQITKLQEIVTFRYTRAAGNAIRGELMTTGVVPAFLEELQKSGQPAPVLQLFAQHAAGRGASEGS